MNIPEVHAVHVVGGGNDINLANSSDQDQDCALSEKYTLKLHTPC